MAISKDNIMTKGLSGMLGGVIVFRQLRGRTLVAGRPHKPRSQSALQRENRLRFKKASAFAKQAMRDPQTKEYYRVRAHKLKLPNAYTAALTDYMRKPGITAIRYKDNAHGNIAITAGKAGFSLASVTVALVNEQGTTLASGMAVLKDRRRNEWTARLSPRLGVPDNINKGESVQLARSCVALNCEAGFSQGRRILVTAVDRAGNSVNLLAA